MHLNVGFESRAAFLKWLYRWISETPAPRAAVVGCCDPVCHLGSCDVSFFWPDCILRPSQVTVELMFVFLFFPFCFSMMAGVAGSIPEAPVKFLQMRLYIWEWNCWILRYVWLSITEFRSFPNSVFWTILKSSKGERIDNELLCTHHLVFFLSHLYAHCNLVVKFIFYFA